MKYYKIVVFILLIFVSACGGGDDNNMTPNPLPEVNRPPMSFSLLLVPDNENNVLLNPELKWEASVDPDSDAVTYDVLLDTNSGNPSTIIASNLQTTNYLVNSSLQFNTSYSWKVIAKDSKGATVSSVVFSFTTRELQVAQATNDAEFVGREGLTMLAFKNRIWVIDGFELGDVWSSADGMNWTEEISNASFPNRFGHASVVFNDKLWIIGGTGNNIVYNDVWSSTDGINWVQETGNASFSKRHSHTAITFKDKIWVIGGEDGSFENDEIWSSADGIDWVLENDSPPFLARYAHTSVAFNDRIWIIGGLNSVQGSGVGELNDVWSSEDGITWAAATVDADFSIRYGHASAVYKDKIWVIGGSGSNVFNDIWSSADGIHWKEEINNTPFPGRMGHSSTTFDDKIWFTSGWSNGSLINDVWYVE